MSWLRNDPGAAWHIVGTGDFNGDGCLDILWRNDDGSFSDWLGSTYAGLVVNDVNAYTAVSMSWTVSGTGDFNGDSKSDVVWRQTNGDMSDWLGNLLGGFYGNDAAAYRNVATNWHIIGTGDFNGDHRWDILWRNDAGDISNWLGTATGSFVGNDSAAYTAVSLSWQVVGTGDFNGDGRSDILWRNDAGLLTNWLGTANGGYFHNDNNLMTAVSAAWKIAGTADFNGDGYTDLLWRNDNGAVSNWLGQANGSFVANDLVALAYMPVSAQVAAVGDFNGDGYGDILWRDGHSFWSWDGWATGGFSYNNGVSPASGSAGAQNGNPSAVDNHYTESLSGHGSLNPGMSVEDYLNNLSYSMTEYLLDSLSPPVSTSPGSNVFGYSLEWIPGAPGNGDNTEQIVNGGHFLMTWTPFSSGGYDSVQPSFAISQPAIAALLMPGAHSPPPTTPTVSGWNRPRDAQIDAVAKQVQAAINQAPHSLFHEYGAYIYQLPNGEIHSSAIREGVQNQVTTRLADYNIPEGTTLLAFVHSHPPYNELGNPTWGADYSDIDDYRFLQDFGHLNEKFSNETLQDEASGTSFKTDLMWRTYTVTDTAVHEYDYVQNKTLLPDAPSGTPIIGIEGEFIPDLIL